MDDPLPAPLAAVMEAMIGGGIRDARSIEKAYAQIRNVDAIRVALVELDEFDEELRPEIAAAVANATSLRENLISVIRLVGVRASVRRGDSPTTPTTKEN